jgi:hypothetical protein
MTIHLVLDLGLMYSVNPVFRLIIKSYLGCYLAFMFPKLCCAD